MATITTIVPSFTAVPDIADPTNFEANGNTFLNEINARYVAGNAQVLEINAVRNEMVGLNATTSGYTTQALNYSNSALSYSNSALGYRNTALTYQTGAQSAYNSTLSLVNNLVIPTSATYTYTEADAKFTSETENFLNFKIGE